MADMGKIVGATIGISVSVIVIANILVPVIQDNIGTDGALAEYSGLLSAVIIITIVGVLMIAVRLISSRY